MTTKKDSRRDADESEELEDAQRFRIDRVYIPAKGERGSAPATIPPQPSRPLRPRTPTASSGGTPALGVEAAESELRRQVSKVQRQLSEAQRELANKEEQLAVEIEQRVAIAREHDTLVEEQQALTTKLEELTSTSATRTRELDEQLGIVQARAQALIKERDELVRQRDELAALRDTETRMRDDESRQRVELARERDALAIAADGLRRERDELVATRDATGREREGQVGELHTRIAALEAELEDTHKRWATERREVVEQQTTEIGEMEAMHKAALDAAVVAAKAAEAASAGIEIATVKAESDRDRQKLQSEVGKLRAEVDRIKADAATELTRLRESHDSAIARAKAESAADLTRLLDEHGSVMTAAKSQSEKDRSHHASEVSRLRDAHIAALDEMRAETQRTAAARDERHKQGFAQAVINNAADQATMARKHGEAVSKLEASVLELERALDRAKKDAEGREAHWEHAMRTASEKHAQTLHELADANQLGAALQDESRQRADELATANADLDAARGEIDRLRELRAALAGQLQAGIALIQGSAAASAAAEAPIEAPPEASGEEAPVIREMEAD